MLNANEIQTILDLERERVRLDRAVRYALSELALLADGDHAHCTDYEWTDEASDVVSKLADRITAIAKTGEVCDE